MILGFTGTRDGMTAAQKAALPSVIATLPEQVLHGGAIGADEEFDLWLRPQWNKTFRIFIYPSNAERFQHWQEAYAGLTNDPATIYAPEDPLVRNRIIVERCDHLLACPATMEEVLRSGTWATIRYARRRQRARTIIWPNGTVTGGFAPERSLRR